MAAPGARGPGPHGLREWIDYTAPVLLGSLVVVLLLLIVFRWIRPW